MVDYQMLNGRRTKRNETNGINSKTENSDSNDLSCIDLSGEYMSHILSLHINITPLVMEIGLLVLLLKPCSFDWKSIETQVYTLWMPSKKEPMPFKSHQGAPRSELAHAIMHSMLLFLAKTFTYLNWTLSTKTTQKIIIFRARALIKSSWINDEATFTPGNGSQNSKQARTWLTH